MDKKERENLRLLVLSAISAAKGYAVEVQHLRPNLPPRLKLLPAEDIEFELQYLEDCGFIEQEEKAISPENKQWKIKKAGRDHLAKEGME